MTVDTEKLPRLVRFSAALRELGLSESTGNRLLKRADNGLPRPFVVGGVRYYRRGDLVAFFEDKARATKSA